MATATTQPTRTRGAAPPPPPSRSAPPASAALPAPRFATAWAALVYAVASMTLAYPALFGQFLINPRSDQYKAGYAFREFAASWLRAGHGFPQWNPYLLGGLPYVAAMHGDIFYPTFLLRMVMPTDRAMTWEFVIHIVLAGLFTYQFLRAWGVSFYPALIAGLAYMMSGPIAAYAAPGHDGKLFVSALMPLALLLVTRGVRDGKHWAWGALAVTVGLTTLSPHPQLLQYSLLTSGAFAVYLAFADTGAGKLDRATAIRRLAFAGGAVMLGLLIGAIQFLPVREYVPWSPRGGGRGYEFATSFSMPIEELLNTIVPQFSGILDLYWGRNFIHFHSEYAGAAVILLATAAIGAGTRISFRRFWGGALVVSILWALGGYTPFYHLVYAVVPGTHYFRAPSTMMYVSMFSVAVFAGLGAERILSRQISRRFVLGWAIAAVVIALLGASGGLTSLAHAVASTFPGQAPRDQAIDANAASLTFGALRSGLALLIVAGICWAVTTDRLGLRPAALSLLAVVAVDLWSIERLYWQFDAPASVLFASDAAIDSVRAAKEPGRVLALDLLGTSDQTGDAAFGRDGMMTHDVRTLVGYHGNELNRFEKLMGKMEPDAQYPGEQQINPAIWRQENVRYLYTTLPDSLVAEATKQFHWPAAPTKIVGPVRDAAGTTIYLYRMPGDNPAAWVATARVKATDDQAVATVSNANFDPTRAALVDPSVDSSGISPTEAPPPAPQKAATTRFEPGAIDVQLDSPATAGQTLVVSENYYPGWRATVDGKPAAAERANYNLIGVPLPAGARNVQLRFTDAAYETGKAVTIVALLAALIVWIGGGVVDRRMTAPTEA
jgi:Bacterial membrane protein YfhO